MLFIALCVYESVLSQLGLQSGLPGTAVIICRAAQRYRQTAGWLVCGSCVDTHSSLNVTFNWMSHCWNNGRQYWSVSAAATGCLCVNKISKLRYQQLLNKDKYQDKHEQKGNLRMCVCVSHPAVSITPMSPADSVKSLQKRCCHDLKVSEKDFSSKDAKTSCFSLSLSCALMHTISCPIPLLADARGGQKNSVPRYWSERADEAC